MIKKIRVLIVDDSPDMRSVLQNFIHFLAPDIEVIAAASNGLEGLALTKQHCPDVVLMDVNLPGIDGLSATKTIVREIPHSRVILMSGHQEPEYQHQGRQAGARHMFVKPIDSDELISTIRTVYAH